MRQAGRFLPEYQKIRQQHSLNEMFQTPQVAAEITCLPVNILDVDAAILFADILTMPAQMGFDISFSQKNGPVIKNPLTSASDAKRIKDFDDAKHIRETISQVTKQLPGHIPLIGFAGAPFTVLCYLIEGSSSASFKKSFHFLYEFPDEFRLCMGKITQSTIKYLKLQENAGIKIFQLFDTWGGLLQKDDYEKNILPFVQQIFNAIDLPSIYYLKNCEHLLGAMEQSGADFLSVCEKVNIASDPALRKTSRGIQGNLYNGLLYEDFPVLEKETLRLLQAAKNYKKYIFNLNHGVFPDTDVEKVKFVIQKVHEYNKN